MSVPVTSFNAYVMIAGVNLSDHATMARFTENADMLDKTAFGDRAHAKQPGLFDAQLQVDFLQDFVAASVHATLDPLIGTTFTVAYRPVNTAISPTNPEYSFLAMLQNYDPATGQVGALLKTSVTFLSAGNVTRATS